MINTIIIPDFIENLDDAYNTYSVIKCDECFRFYFCINDTQCEKCEICDERWE